MKKLFVVFLCALMCFSAAAENDSMKLFLGGGFRIPTRTEISFKNSSLDDCTRYFDTGIDISGMGTFDNGFSVRAILDFNLTFSNIYKDTGVGFNTNALVGLGYAPVRNDHFTLGIYGVLGNDYVIDSARIETNFNGKKKKIDVEIEYDIFALGGNVTALFTPVDAFSIYLSATALCGFPTEAKITSKADGESSSVTHWIDFTFIFLPSVGIGWKF